jgi:hypothetical protein
MDVSRTAGRWQELARTENQGAAAVLLWDESSSRVRVALSDERLCHFVDFEIRGAEQLKALREPFGDVVVQLTRRNGTKDRLHKGETA